MSNRSVVRLEVANANAYQAGCEAAYASYQNLSRRHIAERKKPRIRLDRPLDSSAAAGVGVVVGRAIP